MKKIINSATKYQELENKSFYKEKKEFDERQVR